MWGFLFLGAWLLPSFLSSLPKDVLGVKRGSNEKELKKALDGRMEDIGSGIFF